MVDNELATTASGGRDQYEEHPLSQSNALWSAYDYPWFPTSDPLDWFLRRWDFRWAILQHVSDDWNALLPDKESLLGRYTLLVELHGEQARGSGQPSHVGNFDDPLGQLENNLFPRHDGTNVAGSLRLGPPPCLCLDAAWHRREYDLERSAGRAGLYTLSRRNDRSELLPFRHAHMPKDRP